MAVCQQEQLHVRDLVVACQTRALRIAEISQINVDRPKFVGVISAIFFQTGKSVSNGLLRTSQRAAGDAQKCRLR
jgi:hypothetical protein